HFFQSLTVVVSSACALFCTIARQLQAYPAFFQRLAHTLENTGVWGYRKSGTYCVFTLTPCRATFIGSSVAPTLSITASTFARASGSITSATHPPPPAPHTLPAAAPLRRAPEMIRSIIGVEIVGRLRRRIAHSSFTSRPSSVQRFFASAS